jgi:hypothetical protein
MQKGSQSIPHYCQLCLNHCMICWVFPWPNFEKIRLPNSKRCSKKRGKSYTDPPKPKRTCNVLNLSNEAKLLDLLKGGTSLAEVGQHCGKKMSQASAVQHWTLCIPSIWVFLQQQVSWEPHTCRHQGSTVLYFDRVYSKTF